MAIPQLPAGVVKYYRESDGHYFIWDGCFTNPLIDLSDPPAGLGAAINEIYAETLTPIAIESVDDDEFQAWINFLQASRDDLENDIAAAVVAALS